jgi:3-deoxy-7-phosphoheptulonate synthase
MIISMRPHATRDEIDHVCERIREFGYKVHSIEGEERVVIGVVGVGDVTACLESLEATPGVESAMRISAPYKFVSKEFKKEHSIIRVNGLEIGGDEFIVMAGPCSVESERQIMETAEEVASAGAKMLRGGAFKPRTSPYAFQGLGDLALEILVEAREETGLPLVTELMDPRHVEAVVEVADVIQIGARNMSNFSLLSEVGRAPKPVLLKRGLSSTVEDLLMAAEYIVKEGNSEVILCERGIKTFETSTRFTLDISAIPVLKMETHLPVIVDPSHPAGRRELVLPLARAAVAAGADGIIVEVHPRPEEALCDAAQQIPTSDFPDFAAEIRALASLMGRTIG